MKLTVFLGQDCSDSFDIGLIDNKFTNKWLDELSWCLENCEFDHNECFVDFLSVEKRQQKLLECIEIINNYLKKIYKRNFIDVPKEIDWFDQEFFNYLHLKFESLSGNYGDQTKLFQVAPEHVKQAIRDLNFFVHALETGEDKINFVESIFKIAFHKNQYRRFPLELEDYFYFSHDRETNGLYLSYVELGKTLIEIYEENLPLDYKNLKNLHFYSGECFLHLDENKGLSENFIDFCV